MADLEERQHAFLANGGEMGARMRAHDWTATPLGAPETWPQSLRSVVSAVLNSPILGTVLWGPDLRMLYNDAYVPSLADRHPEALGHPVAEVWGETWQIVSPPFLRAMVTGEGFGQERVELSMTRNGQPETTYWNISAAPIRGENGSIVGLLNQGIETTAQVRMEHYRYLSDLQMREVNIGLRQEVTDSAEDLVRSERRAAAYFDFSEDYLFLVRMGPDGVVRFEDANPATERVMGLVRANILGQPIQALLPVNAFEDIDRNTRLCLEKRQPQRYRAVRAYREGHRVVVDARATFVERFDGGGGLVLFSGHDVTDQLALEEQLRQSQKMEAVGQLTGGLAHDFNNLLVGISGSLELMNTRISQGRFRDIDKYMAAAQTSTRRAAALTHRLLAFSRRQTLAPKPTNVNTLVSGMLDLIRRTVGPSVDVTYINRDGIWTVLIDPPQLENALLNLCINARDAMPSGGRITIEAAHHDLNEDQAKLRDVTEGQYITLSVSDNGVGMPPDVVAKAFDPFFTTKPIGEGTGLGLSMIYGFAKQSGGQARIYSEVGHGTIVRLYMPRFIGEGEVSSNAGIDALPVQRAEAGETVLIVDDEPTVRLLVSDVLEELGYVTIEAADGAGGLRVLHSDARVDLLVTDVGLPGGMNGRQMVDAARVYRPDLKVLFITGFAENALLNNGQLEPGMAVLTKPFSLEVLGSRVRELIRR